MLDANSPAAPKGHVIAALLAEREAIVEWLYARAGASRWGLVRERFAEALKRSAEQRFGTEAPSPKQLDEYLGGLHGEDLALACACEEGIEAAWEHFVANYRGYLRSAAAAILRRPPSSAEACEFGDSLFAELYGWNSKAGRRSLFRWYHGRSKLSTWLRAVLAQRHVDAIRQSKRFESLDEESEANFPAPDGGALVQSPDPDRARYLAALSGALNQAMRSLSMHDRVRLSAYYLNEWTLARIGREFGEHEATASRKLERIRGELRSAVERILRAGSPALDGRGASPGLDDAQIKICFEYALEDWAFDLRSFLEADVAPPPRSEAAKPDS